MKRTNASEAKAMKIFVIENGEVVETNLYDHVAASAEQVTSPRGVEYRVFVEEVEVVENIEGQGDVYSIEYELLEWLKNGRTNVIDRFDTEEAAQDEWFWRCEAYDFEGDDQRITEYWFDEGSAMASMQR